MSILRERFIVGSLAIVGIVGMAVVPTVSAITSNGVVRAAIGSAITIDSVTPATLSLSITPVSGGSQTTNSVAVNVTTNSSLGYKLGLLASTATLTNGGSNIPASANTAWGSAAALANNTWGFGIPSGTPGLTAASGFDATYTATTNQISNALKFMAVPTSNLDVRNVSSGPVSGSSTTFWYSAKADMTKVNGNYESTITYTAIAN